VASVPAVTSPFGVGLGVQEPFRGDTPAAGSAFTYNVPGLYAVRFLSLVFTVAAANAGSNRLVTVEYRGLDGLPFAISEPTTLLAINSSNRYVADPAYSFTDVQSGSDVCFPLSQVLLYPGNQLVIAITTINASDTITGIRGVVEQFRYDRAWLPEALPE
jgi:hypothetical protein